MSSRFIRKDIMIEEKSWAELSGLAQEMSKESARTVTISELVRVAVLRLLAATKE